MHVVLALTNPPHSQRSFPSNSSSVPFTRAACANALLCSVRRRKHSSFTLMVNNGPVAILIPLRFRSGFPNITRPVGIGIPASSSYLFYCTIHCTISAQTGPIMPDFLCFGRFYPT
jgi:hypothetical protein